MWLQAIFPFVTKAFYEKIKYIRLPCLFYASDPYDYYTIICWHIWEHARACRVSKIIFWCNNTKFF